MCNNETFNSLKILDRTALRAVYNIPMRDSISYKYKEKNILDINQLCQVYMCKFLHRLDRQDLRAGDFDLVFKKTNIRTNVNLRHANSYDLPPRIRFEYLKKHPFIQYAVTYNNIPAEIKQIEKTSTFVKAVKRFFLTGDAQRALDLLDLEEITIF